MRKGYSEQFACPSVVLLTENRDADEVVGFAEQIGAVYQADLRYFVIRFPGHDDEVYTESALRRSLKSTEVRP